MKKWRFGLGGGVATLILLTLIALLIPTGRVAAQEETAQADAAADEKSEPASLSETVVDIKTKIIDSGPELFQRVLVFLLILAVFWVLASIIKKVMRKLMANSRLEISGLLQDFFESVAAKTTIIIGVLVALSQLGLDIGPMIASLGVAGFVIGFALKDSLSNFAAGIMILLYRPFDEGDVIEAAGVVGKVEDLTVASTTMITPDNQLLVVPNSMIWGGVIRNVTALDQRRVDLTFGIGYEDDIDQAEKILHDLVNTHELVLDDPEPVIQLHNLGESSVDFIVRPWCKTSDYWQVFWDITEDVKRRFDEEGISIPYPQQDVHYRPVGAPIAE